MTKFLLFTFLLTGSLAFAQRYGLGIILEDSLLEKSPVAAPLMRGDYGNLPAKVSLKRYTPTPGDQGGDATCAGWATAYGGRTILEAVKDDIAETSVDSNTFSPSFVYNQIRSTGGCNGGSSIIDALNILKYQGGQKLNQFGYDCSREVTEKDRQIAHKYKIIEYREIVSPKTDHKERFIKKSLAEMHPVVIAFDAPYSFENAKEIWLPDSSDFKLWNRGHAMIVIGYDDDKYKGAFEILNSWGKSWGKKGFSWIRYSDFNYFCKYGFELIDSSKTDPNRPDLSGSLSFRKNNGDEMASTFNGEYFVMNKPYSSGTLFELFISNNEPAYVYAFSSDLSYKTYKIFPFTNRMLAYLPYKQNNIAIPDESNFNMLDENTGTSYFCFLYSKENLEIDSVLKEVENVTGSFWERIKKVLSNKIVDNKNIEYKYKDKITFRGRSLGKTVIPVLVEIKHNN